MTEDDASGQVRIVEVGPRDGLQNEPASVPTTEKIALIRLLAAAGLREIEATAFVHPKWIPAMADAAAVLAGVPCDGGIRYHVLIPNMRGYERAIAAARPDEICLVCSASESHNHANLNRSTEESLAELATVAARARANGITIRGAVSTAFWCPFEGRVPEARVVWVATQYAAMGVKEVGLADTLGAADPAHVRSLVRQVRSAVGCSVALHLHDTYGMALACVLAALEEGITCFDGAIGGLGGCPYAPGAAGNVATEDLVFMLHRLGVRTGVNENALLDAAHFAQSLVGHPLASHRMAVVSRA